MSSFERPESLKFPTIYREFASKKGGNLKFRVQDLPEECFEEAIELLVNHFIPEETFCVAKKVSNDDEVRNITVEFYREILSKRISVGCFSEDSSELIAVNIMETKSNDDERPEVSREVKIKKSPLSNIDYF
jgi:hypothetical protein